MPDEYKPVPNPKAKGARKITLKYMGECLLCHKPVEANSKAWWQPEGKSVTHLVCPDPSKYLP
jgi:hypothetical protein